MIVLSWNVRGLGSLAKRALIKAALFDVKPKIAILLETKIQSFDYLIVCNLWYDTNPAWANVGAIGHSGGIIVIWDPIAFDAISVIPGQYSIGLQLLDHNLGTSWALAGIYGPTRSRDRASFWEEIFQLVQLWDLPWLIGGDFNATLLCSDKSPSASRTSSTMRAFSDFINSLALSEAPLSGKKFT
ncbi:uncharacterized protein [Aristolochia californica]|uniref:uncharacterized protein n=1 Tax=Aristolochia californica TaxID=171875 RepID=UPI0035D913AF